VTLAAPGITVQQPAGASLTNGGANVALTAVMGTSSAPATFTLLNTTPAVLTIGTINVSGTNAADFAVNTTGLNTSLGPNNSTTFSILFTPATAAVTQTRTATLQIASNDPSNATFTVTLTGHALSPNSSTGGDGMNDALKFQLAAEGFNWQVSQPSLVSSFLSGNALYNQTQYNANYSAGQNNVINSPNTFSLYTLSQVENLNAAVPLLVRNASTGQFTLTIAVQKATALGQPFVAFPMSSGQTTIDGQGKLEFTFTVPDNAAFFRLQAQ
jgi:hypothetical protein